MRDDFQFNIQFCEEVQQYETLFNYRRSDYCNRSAQDQAWEKIAKKFNANVTECKDRWKNIRGSYSKYKAKLKTKSGQEAKQVKEYYLAPHLLFLDPFLKSRKSKGNIDKDWETSLREETERNEHEATDVVDEVLSPDNNSSSSASCFSPLSFNSTSIGSESTLRKVQEAPTPKRDDFRKRKLPVSAPSINDVNQKAYQYFEKKQQMLEEQNPTKTNTTIESLDPDLAFFTQCSS
ncbi:hypothetical protein FQR65_LT16337 [Abscondita terminalis]|nr:hypothetical protein FQR65_LT16337 [Abscondita terminalis]